MKNIFGFLFLFAFCYSVSAQEAGPGNGGINLDPGGMHILSQQFFADALGGKYESNDFYSTIDGQPFLSVNAIESTLILTNGREVKNVPLLIDLYSKEYIAIIEGEDDIYLDEKFLNTIIVPFAGDSLVFKKINQEEPEKFYEVLFENGNISFFKERYVTVKEASSNGFVKKKASFTGRHNYFIKNGNVLEKVKLRKNKILSCFSKEDARSLKEYIKSNNIKLKSEADYVALFNQVDL